MGIIPALTDAWAPKFDLNGFTYRSAGKADKFKHWLGRIDRYAPQPYDQLASVVQSQGNGTLATDIRYSGREAGAQRGKRYGVGLADRPQMGDRIWSLP